MDKEVHREGSFIQLLTPYWAWWHQVLWQQICGFKQGGTSGGGGNWAPCHRREFNPKGGPYKMFQMILSFVTKTFQNILVFKILNEGKWCFWHSISIT